MESKEPLQGVLFFRPLEPCSSQAPTQDLNRLIVTFSIHWIWMAVFTSVGEAKLHRVFPRGRSTMCDFRDQGQGPECLCPYTWHPQKCLKIIYLGLIGLEQDLFDGIGMKVPQRDLVMSREGEGLEHFEFLCELFWSFVREFCDDFLGLLALQGNQVEGPFLAYIAADRRMGVQGKRSDSF